MISMRLFGARPNQRCIGDGCFSLRRGDRWRRAQAVQAGCQRLNLDSLLFPGHLAGYRIVKTDAPAKYRISGHESFACRYTWLPKSVRGLKANPALFSDEEKAMVDLGVGKNMVRSIRFWSQASGVITASAKGCGHSVTEFGQALLGEGGFDPFMEDIRTLWLFHWNLATNRQNPLLAWDFLLNRWQEPELIPSTVVSALQKEVAKSDEGPSLVTIDQHWDTFLHSYFPTRGRKGDVQEDNLDSPLTELTLIIRIGERPLDRPEGRAESIYAFRREDKPEITPELFIYALDDFWNERHSGEKTLSFRQVAHGHGSPGQVFKIPEHDVRDRLDSISKATGGFFSFSDSSQVPVVTRNGEIESIDLLSDIFEKEGRIWQ